MGRSSLAITTGRVLVIGALALLFVAYSTFSVTVFPSEAIADSVKNHFVREIIFGGVLAGWTIRLALRPIDAKTWRTLAIAGTRFEPANSGL